MITEGQKLQPFHQLYKYSQIKRETNNHPTPNTKNNNSNMIITMNETKSQSHYPSSIKSNINKNNSTCVLAKKNNYPISFNLKTFAPQIRDCIRASKSIIPPKKRLSLVKNENLNYDCIGNPSKISDIKPYTIPKTVNLLNNIQYTGFVNRNLDQSHVALQNNSLLLPNYNTTTTLNKHNGNELEFNKRALGGRCDFNVMYDPFKEVSINSFGGVHPNINNNVNINNVNINNANHNNTGPNVMQVKNYMNMENIAAAPYLSNAIDPNTNNNTNNFLNENFELSIYNVLLNSRYRITKTLGKGSFGKVYQSYDYLEQRYVALKVIMSDNNASINQSLIERSILNELNMFDSNKDHVVSLLDDFMWNNHRCFVFELLNMNLYELLQMTQGNGLNLGTIKSIALKLLLSLTLLYDHNIIHCDLKPENIMVSNDSEGFVKLVDFGSSCKVGGQIYSYIQSRFYRAPEVMLELNYSKPIDIWSLGCLLAEMSTCEPLFCGRNELDQMAQIIHYFGFPPNNLIAKSKKAHKFFVYNSLVGSYDFVGDNSIKFNGPYSRSFKDYLMRNKPNCANFNATVDGLLFKGLSSIDDSFENFVYSMLNYDPDSRANPYDLMFHPFIFNVVSLNLNVNAGCINFPTFCTLIKQYRTRKPINKNIPKKTSSMIPINNLIPGSVSDSSNFYTTVAQLPNNFMNAESSIPQQAVWIPPCMPENTVNTRDAAPPPAISLSDYPQYNIIKTELNFIPNFNNNNIPPLTTASNIQSKTTVDIKPFLTLDLRRDKNPHFIDNNLNSNSPSIVTPQYNNKHFQRLMIHDDSQSNITNTTAMFVDPPMNVLNISNNNCNEFVVAQHQPNDFINQFKHTNNFISCVQPVSYEDRSNNNNTHWMTKPRLTPIQVANNVFPK